VAISGKKNLPMWPMDVSARSRKNSIIVSTTFCVPLGTRERDLLAINATANIMIVATHEYAT
jgi:hypothetical protein